LNPALKPGLDAVLGWQALRGTATFVIGDDSGGAQLGRMNPERWSTMYKQLLDLKVIDKAPSTRRRAYTFCSFVQTK